MKLSIEPYGAEHEAAAADFNRRMRAADASTPFLLNERSTAPRNGHSVSVTDYVAVDEGGAVRGGVLCWDHPALVGGVARRVINVQSPLSEGIIDRAYMPVGPQLILSVLSQSPYAYAVGMGAEQNPLPRLLKAMGWTVRSIPFYFWMLRPARCVRQLAPLRDSPWKRIVSNVAASTGAAAIGGRIAHRSSLAAHRAARDYDAEPVTTWGDWTDPVWESFAAGIAFGVLRTRATLPFFYPMTAQAPLVWKVTRGGSVEGWFALTVSRMRGNPYFGDLNVATLSDCVGSPAAMRAACVHAVRTAKRIGADLLITNQVHEGVRKECVAAGARVGPSNFLVATSKALAAEVNDGSMYVTRRDGDGLVNLLA